MYQTDINATKTFLLELLQRTTGTQALDWLNAKLEKLASGEAKDRDLYLAFSAAPRFVGKNKLQVFATDLQQANQLRTGFTPANWSADQAARTLLLLSVSEQTPGAFYQKIEKLFNTADMDEQVALYASLPLLPHPEKFVARASEGVRSNIGSVFEAIALDNPYPADYMEEDAWNQLVLKTIFVGKPLYQIYGIDKRRNSKLARMLSDYAHERWAAGRTVTPELWRSVGPFLDEHILQDIKKLFFNPDLVHQEAAALACWQSNFKPAKELLAEYPQLKEMAEHQELSWDRIGQNALLI